MSYTLGDIAFIVDELETYKYAFQNSRKEFINEYIHCIVKERLEEWDGYKPRKIKVNQIHNLEEFFSNPAYNNFTERILITDNILEMIK